MQYRLHAFHTYHNMNIYLVGYDQKQIPYNNNKINNFVAHKSSVHSRFHTFHT